MKLRFGMFSGHWGFEPTGDFNTAITGTDLSRSGFIRTYPMAIHQQLSGMGHTISLDEVRSFTVSYYRMFERYSNEDGHP